MTLEEDAQLVRAALIDRYTKAPTLLGAWKKGTKSVSLEPEREALERIIAAVPELNRWP